jgi:nicotinamide-nucleotide amidase
VARQRAKDDPARAAALAKRFTAVRHQTVVRSLDRVSARAGIVVTGTEVLTGRVQDRNGPWIAERLLELGVELAHITICGDRPRDIEAQLRFLADEGVDLIVTSGGLGPTADDMTVETVARFSGRELVLDAELENKIAAILKSLMARFDHVDFDAVRAANRKQALIPAGALVIDPIGTAPGVVVPGKPTVVVLPGPPRELQPMWQTAVATPAVQEAIAGRTIYRQATVRMFGLPESGLAETLRDAQNRIPGFEVLEITTCLRRGEIEMVTRYEPPAAGVYAQLVELLRDRHGHQIYSEDGSRVDDQVAQLLSGRRIATAESCTAGLLAARLTELPGSSAYVAGGVVAYANEAKVQLLGVDSALIEAHGAVSEPVAEAMAAGALNRFQADTAIAITGIAGPGGGTAEKPVGTVCFSVMLAGGQTLTRTVRLPGNRADIRERSTTVAMHLLRRALSGADDAAGAHASVSSR